MTAAEILVGELCWRIESKALGRKNSYATAAGAAIAGIGLVTSVMLAGPAFADGPTVADGSVVDAKPTEMRAAVNQDEPGGPGFSNPQPDSQDTREGKDVAHGEKISQPRNQTPSPSIPPRSRLLNRKRLKLQVPLTFVRMNETLQIPKMTEMPDGEGLDTMPCRRQPVTSAIREIHTGSKVEAALSRLLPCVTTGLRAVRSGWALRLGTRSAIRQALVVGMTPLLWIESTGGFSSRTMRL